MAQKKFDKEKWARQEAEMMYQRSKDREGEKSGGEGFQQKRNAMKSARENYFNDYEREFGKDVRRRVVNGFAEQDIQEKKVNQRAKQAKLNNFLRDLDRNEKKKK